LIAVDAATPKRCARFRQVRNCSASLTLSIGYALPYSPHHLWDFTPLEGRHSIQALEFFTVDRGMP
jgi:hypothetical protein